jgi:hypothetical protein
MHMHMHNPTDHLKLSSILAHTYVPLDARPYQQPVCSETPHIPPPAIQLKSHRMRQHSPDSKPWWAMTFFDFGNPDARFLHG